MGAKGGMVVAAKGCMLVATRSQMIKISEALCLREMALRPFYFEKFKANCFSTPILRTLNYYTLLKEIVSLLLAAF